MKKFLPLVLTAATIGSILLHSCEKEEEPEQVVCSTGSQQLEAIINDSKWCANVSIWADFAIQMVINGIGLSAWTVTLELDDTAPGTYEMSESTNYTFFTIGGVVYESTDAQPCILEVLENDTASNRFRGQFSGTFHSPLGGSKTVTNGLFDVNYTE